MKDIFVLRVYAIVPPERSLWRQMEMKIRGIAHRGYPKIAPENTMSSFQAAYDLSFSHLEMDVHLSKDGVPVILHDASINRVSDREGRVKDYTADELKTFRVYGTETIPTLEELLVTFKDRFEFIIELKQEGHLYPGLEEKTLDVIRRTHTKSQSRIISIDHFSLAKV